MKYKGKLLVLLTFIIINACSKNNDEVKYNVCNDLILSSCNGSDTDEYCLFDYTWSSTKTNNSNDSNEITEISYGFIEPGYVFSTHAEDDLVSKSFDDFFLCAKDTIKAALTEWESVANIQFREKENATDCDIKIIVADIRQAGLGYPAFNTEPCSDIAGHLIFNTKLNYTCELFYGLALHEIGHVLGLGHVKSNNVMNPDKNYQSLQAGDIEGIQAIYGTKK